MVTMQSAPHPLPWSLPRRAVAAIAAALASIVWTHGLAALTRHVGPDDPPLVALALSAAAAAVAFFGVLALPRRHAPWMAAASGAVAALAFEAFAPGSWAAACALAPVGYVVTVAARWLGERFPAAQDGAFSARPVVAVVWMLLALGSVVQTGRLAASITDREIGFYLTTDHPFWYKHECIGAYLHGAELAARGETNIYHAHHYPGLDRDAKPSSALEGVALDDPYQYPPHFLLLPHLALAVTDDVPTLRVVWYALQTTLFATVAVALALWCGGAAGRIALLAIPIAMASFPALHNFQFGQFHLPALALSIAAMLAFAKRRHALGGGLLATAILAKLFPAVLLPYLAAQRRWKELAWTGGAIALVTIATLGAFGSQPFVAFFDYHLPRLSDGSAFAFDEAWPELADLVVNDNQGVFGLARKLGAGKDIAAAATRLFALLALAAAAFAGWRGARSPRLWAGASWLALLGLASLASPGAWGDYVPVSAVWLLALLAGPLTAKPRRVIALSVVLLFEYFLLGTMPIGSWAPHQPMLVLSAIGAVLMLVLFGGTLAIGSAAEPVTADAPRRRAPWEETMPLRDLA